MTKQPLLRKPTSVAAVLRDIPISGKMALIVLVPLALVSLAMISLTHIGLSQIEQSSAVVRLQEEVNIITQDFARAAASQQVSLNQLSGDAALLKAIEDQDIAVVQRILATTLLLQSNLNHILAIDTNGRVLAVKGIFEAGNMPAELTRLSGLGLLQVQSTEILVTDQGWLLTSVRPLKTQSGQVVGALSVGWLLDPSGLFILNFGRTNPRLALLDADGRVNAISALDAADNQGGQSFDVDLTAFAQAQAGEASFSQTSIQGELFKIAFAPLILDGKSPGIIGIVFSTATTADLRNQIVLLSLIAAFIVTALATTIAVIFGRTLIVRRLINLATSAGQIANGQLNVVVSGGDSRDEMGVLATAFNNMTTQLHSVIDSLEMRTQQLRASAEVGRAATSILDADQLLRETVNLITERFGFYYTAIFTPDATDKIAVLREATGDAGRTLKERGHQLPVTDQSMVGAAILTHRARIALDVGQGAVRFANPLLPDTRSEIALPLKVGDRVIGALDVQSTQANAFDEANAEVLQTMADQLAVALTNAQTLGRAEQQARVLSRLNQLSRDLALATTLDAISVAAVSNIAQTVEPHRLGLSLATANLNQLMVYPLALGDSNVLGQGHLVDIKQTISGEGFRRGETLYLDDLSTYANRHPVAATLYAEGSRSLVVLPLRAGSRALGTLTITRSVINGFTPDQITQLEQMAAQLAVALENYNLSEQTRTTLQELDAANRRLIGQAWERYARTSDTLAGEWRDGQWVTATRASTPASTSATNGHGLAVPIRVRGETIGEFSVQTDDQRIWTADDVAFAQALIDQVGQVIENARLVEETERFAQREQRIRQITTRIRAASDVQAVLEATTTELAQSLGVSRAIMRLTMGDADTTDGQPRTTQNKTA